jgi:hypothetical protein
MGAINRSCLFMSLSVSCVERYRSFLRFLHMGPAVTAFARLHHSMRSAVRARWPGSGTCQHFLQILARVKFLNSRHSDRLDCLMVRVD